MCVSGYRRQTFLFSATLTLTPEAREKAKIGQKAQQPRKKVSLIDELKGRLRFYHGKPFTVDLSTSRKLVDRLAEYRMDCVKEDKDFYLYYFLEFHVGKTLIFVNSISCVRRLLSLLTILEFSVRAAC